MAHGPCGVQFREAFSCVGFSEQEPKSIDCVEKFQAMQDWFREHADVHVKVRSQFLWGTKPPSLFTIGSDDDDKPNPTMELSESPRKETTYSCAA